MVRRERLLTQIVESHPAVISLVAPPGYGKTTLLAQWAAAHDGPVAWLTIDGLDNDPIVLMIYLGAAFDRVSSITADTSKALAGGSRQIFASAVPRLVLSSTRGAKPD